MEQYLSGDNFNLILTKYDGALCQELKDHMSIHANKQVIHPHPVVAMKQSLYHGHSLDIDEPLMFGPLFATSVCSALKMISYQMYCID